MAKILSFSDKKNERNIAALHDETLIEENRAKLMVLYGQMEHVMKEINHHKQVLRMLEEGNK